MFRTIPLALSLLLATACKAPAEAPEDLGQLSLYLFANFDDEDPDALAAGVEGLDAWLDTLDLQGNVNDRTVAPPLLTGEDLGGVTPPPGVDAEAQVPILVAGESRHPIDVHVDLVGEENRVCIESDTTKYARRTFSTDLDCFLEGECGRVDTENEIRKESLLADVWYDLFADYRTVTLDDGRTVLFGRAWMEESFPADGGGNSWDQLYALEVWIPDPQDPSRTRRVHGLWSSVTLGGVGDDMYANVVKGGIDEGFTNGDDFVDGTMCGNDRDREYDRPE